MGGGFMTQQFDNIHELTTAHELWLKQLDERLTRVPRQLSDEDITRLRQHIQHFLVNLDVQDNQWSLDRWWLFGTLGCHLCEQANALLMQAQAVFDIQYVCIDIIDLPESYMSLLAQRIPVLLTPHQYCSYPFSILDIERLVLSELS